MNGSAADDSERGAGARCWSEALRQQLEQDLEHFVRREAVADSDEGEALRRAAVTLAVVPAVDGDAESAPAVLLTRRSKGLRRHAGQWALPGGRLDPGETEVEAALRELDEELGLRLAPESVLGQLDDYTTRSGFVITPVVVWGVRSQTLVPDPGEVASVHRPTLAAIARPRALHVQKLPWSRDPLLALGILGTMIFAPTAAILHQFAELAIHRRTTRVAHYGQPRFAWK